MRVRLLTIVLVVSLWLVLSTVADAGQTSQPGLSTVLSLSRVAFASMDLSPLQATQDRIEEIRGIAPDLEDDFSTSSGAWELFYEGDTAGFIRNGVYHVTVDVEDTIAWGDSTLATSDFYLEVDVAHVGDPPESEAGILFRYTDDNNFYFYAVSNDGFYRLDKLLDDEWQVLIESTRSSAIDTKEGVVNRLGLLVEGDRMSLLANNVLLEEVEESIISGVEINLAAGSFGEPGVDVAFDNLTFWNLDEDETSSESNTAAGIEAIRGGKPVFQDDFSRITNAWDLGATDDIISSYDNRELHVRIVPSDLSNYSQLDLMLDDFLIEVDIRHIDGPRLSQYGIYFRNLGGDSYYYYAIDGTGEYSLWKRVDGEWELILDWTQSDTLNNGDGAENRLGVLAEGTALALLANDQVLAEVTDNEHSSGAMGIFLATVDEGGLEIAFDNVDVWTVESHKPVEVTLTPPPTPTATPIADLDIDSPGESASHIDEIKSSDPTYRDSFDNEENWATHSTEESESFFVDDALHIRMIPDGRIGWSETDREFADFYLELDVTHVDGPDDAEAGLMFRRVDGLNYFLYAISPSGDYRLDKRVGGEWETLIGWTESDALETGLDVVIRLGLLAEGDNIALFANDTLLTNIEDDTFINGEIALVVGTFDEGNAEAMFDDLSIWDLSRPQQATPIQPPTATSEVDATQVGERIADIYATDPTFSDNFSRDTGAWTMTSTDDVSVSYRRRALQILVDRDNWLAWSRHELNMEDFLVEADVQRIAGPHDAGYGLLFRSSDDDNYYIFRISGLGNYGLWKRIDSEWFDVIGWTLSESIDNGDGAVNRLGVLAEGPQIALVINDTVVAQVEDDSLLSGTSGSSPVPLRKRELKAFDNVDIWDLSQ